MNLKKFDLEKALAGAKVVTRDGREVSQLHRFKSKDVEAVYAVVDGSVECWPDNGLYSTFISENDLFMAPTERKEWVVIWRDKEGNPIQSTVMQEKPSGIENATIHEIAIHE